MPGTAYELTEKEILKYRSAARIRSAREQRDLAELREHAWRVARASAKVLKEQFGATRVVVFGSLLLREWFTPWSDVDMAAWGIPSEKTFLAMGAVINLDSRVEVNLVDMAVCKPGLRNVIEEEGISL